MDINSKRNKINLYDTKNISILPGLALEGREISLQQFLTYTHICTLSLTNTNTHMYSHSLTLTLTYAKKKRVKSRHLKCIHLEFINNPGSATPIWFQASQKHVKLTGLQD